MSYRKSSYYIYHFGILLIGVSLLFLSGCATQGKGMGLGGAIGASTGAIIGGIANPGKDGEYRTRNIVIGTALGGMAGMVGGALIQQSVDKQKENAYKQGKASSKSSSSASMPSLSNPSVETRWIDARAVGNRYIEGHFEYIITEPVRWVEDK